MPRRRRPLDFELLGIEEISAYFQELGKVPYRTVKKASRAGATIVKRAVSSSSQVPIKYGFLKRSFVLVNERRKPGLAATQVTFDARYNSIFQKPIKNPGIYGGKRPTGYYPASMEYGFKNAKGGVGGHRFLQRAALDQQSNAQDKMLEVISKDIDAIKKRG